jgi:predicted nucleic acid-binding OB-fold protein
MTMHMLKAERLEQAGVTVHRAAWELREVRERWPAHDELARRLQAVEEEARTLAGQIVMELHELEESKYGAPR